MNKYIVMLTVIGCMFWAGNGIAADKTEPGKSPTGIAAYSDRELSLEFENLQLKIQQWAQATRDAQSRLAEIQAEAKKRAEKAKAVKPTDKQGNAPKP